MAMKFNTPTDLFGISGAEWVLQSGGNKKAAQTRAEDLGSSGDEIAHALHGKKSTGVCVYTASKAVVELHVWPKVGTVTAAGWHIDSISFRKEAAGWGKLTVNGHKHDVGTAHAVGSCKLYSGSLSLAPRFGIARAIGAVVVLDDETVAGIRSMTYGVTCTHQDEPDGDGAQLAGENNNGKETLAVEFTGDVDIAAELTIAAGWDMPSNGNDGETNTSAVTTSIELVRGISADAGE